MALAIGAGTEQLPFISATQQLGYAVLALDQNPEAVGLKFSDEAVVMDIADENKVLSFVRDKNIHRVIPSPIGRCLKTIGIVNTHLGLPGATKELADVCTDKLLMNRFMGTTSNPGADQEVLVTSPPDSMKEQILRFGFPCIIKPRYGSGSKGVYLLQTMGDLEKGLKEPGALCLEEEYIIESVLQGQEYGGDFLFVNGQLYTLGIREKLVTALPFRQETGYISNMDLPELPQVIQFIRETCLQFSVQSSFFNVDFIVDNAKAYIIELSCRPAGYTIYNKHYPAIYGQTFLKSCLKSFYEQSPFTSCACTGDVQGLFFWDLGEGTLCSYPNLSGKEYPYVTNYELNLKVGEKITTVKNGNDIIHRGHVIIKGASGYIAKENWRHIKELFKFKMEG